MLQRLRIILASLLIGILADAGATQSEVSGAQLYARHCAVCHGEEGRGGVGVPLALPAFLAGVDDAYLERSIRLGRPGRVMPAFTRLEQHEVEAIIRHVRSWQKTTPVPVFAAVEITGDARRGAELYTHHCASCHGDQGQGGQGTGVTFSRPRDLPIIAPALNNPGFLAAASDALLRASLVQGRDGTPMPSARELGLTDRDVDDLVTYLRTFSGTAPASMEIAGEPGVLVMDSPYGLEETVEAVKRAAVGKNFRLIREQRLEEGLFPPEQEDPRQVIIYFCNFKFLYDALALDPRVGLFLPCRVTVVEQAGKVQVMTINPKRLSHLFNNAELDRACDEMYRIYREILEEATL